MKLILLVGPPGSGKSTMAVQMNGFSYINQDSMGKEEHLRLFKEDIKDKLAIVVDRMNFNKEQRRRYLDPAKAAGYETEIHVLHESRETCIQRCAARKDHETIRTGEDAEKAINFFFKNYERVDDEEADVVIRHHPEGDKPSAVICDLDGTMCNTDHRKHWVAGEKKNWAMWNAGIKNDSLNTWCRHITNHAYHSGLRVILCSGRGNETRSTTVDWLRDNKVIYDKLLMRSEGDYRPDSVIKEILLDFEILTRVTPFYIIDDRKQVVDMWRRRGYVCLQCDEGDF